MENDWQEFLSMLERIQPRAEGQSKKEIRRHLPAIVYKESINECQQASGRNIDAPFLVFYLAEFA